MILNLPWPPSILSPNNRSHWAKKMPHKKKYREECGWVARESRATFPDKGDIKITITFHPPDKRNRDDDNIIASFKAGRDGVADGWAVDDKRFKPTYIFSDPIKGGAVIISIN